MRLPILLCAVLPCSIGLVVPQTTARDVATRRAYHSVPAADRDRLQAAVQSAIALQRAAHWDALFALQYNEERLTIEQFADRMRKSPRLLALEVNTVAPIPTGQGWQIYGCAAYDPPPPKGRYSMWSVLYARFKGGEWRLTVPSTIVLKDSPTGRPCAVAREEEVRRRSEKK